MIPVLNAICFSFESLLITGFLVKIWYEKTVTLNSFVNTVTKKSRNMENSTLSFDKIRALIARYVDDYQTENNIKDLWREPLCSCAPADDRFDILPKIAKPDHAVPKDLLQTGKTVVAFFIPFSKQVARENHRGVVPCRSWGTTYQHTNNVINGICKSLKIDLDRLGYQTALVPATHNFDEASLMAGWSHKHVGYITGLGRFGVNAQFITPAGCAGRLGSFVTEADLGDHSLVSANKEFCLYKQDGSCLICVKRCPVDAVSAETGIDRRKCWNRLKHNLKTSASLNGLDSDTHVCGKCQVLVPCSLKAPLKKSLRT